MSNRVLFNASGLKVSDPGVDVLTAGNHQLLFNSDHNCLRLVQRGIVNANFISDFTIPYSKTFAKTPIVNIAPRGKIVPFLYFSNRFVSATVNPITAALGPFSWKFLAGEPGPGGLQGDIWIEPRPNNIWVKSYLGLAAGNGGFDSNHSYQIAYSVWDYEV